MDLPDSIRQFKESENFWVSLARDGISILAIVATFALLSQAVFGLWTPMVAVESGSMEPHMNVGDIIFIQNIDRTEVISHGSADDYSSFGMEGDVILYRPYGQEGVTPIIHRAMYFVEEGEPMWEDGPAAPHAGYITKGDNENTNRYYDQQGMVSYLTPVKEEWIIGVARYRIPYIGHVRLIFS
ncbi:signal peptidase [Methanohalophilus levihalophilus]|uniref:signal peptidase I n=1 Tax=Methanohalophilus levihalophilus TaxID=1431282 RepID=UPI001AE65F67|nr:signal peptidase I [Methanohalophilus levihalophilus]MBP2029918.1 signal peptidase [Methanohalophilus levihalophilus]